MASELTGDRLSIKTRSLLAELCSQIVEDLKPENMISPEIQELHVVMSDSDPDKFTMAVTFSHYTLDFSQCAHGNKLDSDCADCTGFGPEEDI